MGIPRNPTDIEYVRNAIDVIAEAEENEDDLIQFAFFSHRWCRPHWCESCASSAACPLAGTAHPDCAEHKKAAFLAQMGKKVKAQGIDLWYWVDFASIDQDDPIKRTQGIAKLPLYMACCGAMIIWLTDEYEGRAWTRTERVLCYTFAPVSKAFVHDPSGPLKANKALKKSMRGFDLLVTDPRQGHISAETDAEYVGALAECAASHSPVRSRGTRREPPDFNKASMPATSDLKKLFEGI